MKRLTLLLLFSLNSYPNISDMYLEIHSSDYNKFLSKKLEIEADKAYCKIYRYQGKIEVVVKNLDNYKLASKLIKEVCYEKLSIVNRSTIDDYLLNFEFDSTSHDYQIYSDKTGVSEINEIWVKKLKDQLSLIEKRSIGTTRINMKLKDDQVKSVEISVYEGTQSIESTHELSYKNQLPEKIISNYIQKLTKRNIGKFQRKFNETFEFKNYKINKNIALKHFSRK